MLFKTLAISGVLLTAFAAVLPARPWAVILNKYQIRQAKKNRNSLLKTAKKHTDSIINPLDKSIHEFTVSKSWGAAHGAEASAKLIDDLNLIDQRVMGMGEFSLLDNSGFLDTTRIEDDYRKKVIFLNHQDQQKPRDLGKVVVTLTFLGSIMAIFGILGSK